MEYVQMTLTDWVEMKRQLERELNNLKTGFVRVGYVLRRIEETKGYEQDGYASITDFAKAEYQLSASTVSRFMAINERFSLDGYSERLDPKYLGFGQSIMSEMLGLPDMDIPLIRAETPRTNVRELKAFNREPPEVGVADDMTELLEAFFREDRELLNALYASGAIADNDRLKEILNPTGTRMYRKGLFMMFFYADDVKIKKFGNDPLTFTWQEYGELIDKIFGMAAAGEDTWSHYYGEPEPEVVKPGSVESGRYETERAEPEHSERKEAESEHAESGTNTPDRKESCAEERGRKNDPDTENEGKDVPDSDGEESLPEGAEEASAWENTKADTDEPDGFAPAQFPEQTEQNVKPSRYRKGDTVTVRGRIESVAGVKDGRWKYMIRTMENNTIFAFEEDIATEVAI